MMKGEKGLTMADLVMAVAVTAFIISFLGTAIYQMLTVTEYGNERLIALHELQNAAHWLGLDGQGAVSATGGDELVLSRADDTSVTYSLSSTDLRRIEGGSSMTLAQHITDIQFSVADRLVTMTITSSPQEGRSVSENQTYQVYIRAGGGGG